MSRERGAKGGKTLDSPLSTLGFLCRHTKNPSPTAPQKPFATSGTRLGTPAMTTRGFTELEAEQLAHLIADVLDAPTDEAVIERVKGDVAKLTAQFPVYG